MTITQSQSRPANVVLNHRNWFHAIARVGIASRGIIYLVSAYLAFDIARHGNAPAQTSATGALQEVKTRPGGTALLVILAIGLGCYGLWRALDALTRRQDGLKRFGSVAIAALYFWLFAQAVTLITGSSKTGSTGNPVPIVAKVLRWSGGPVIVEIAGAVLVGAGAALAVWGTFHDIGKDLALGQLRRTTQRLVRVSRGVGDAARGFLVILVGVYLVKAGAVANPTQAKSVDESLMALVRHPYGAVLIGLVAFGLLCFAVYSFFDARLRSIE